MPYQKRHHNHPVERAKRALMKLTAPRFQRVAGEAWFWLGGQRRFGFKPTLNSIRSVLVIRPDEVGDVVLISAFLRELRRNLPNAKITLIVKKATYNVVELCPYVNQILLFPIAETLPEYLTKFERWKWKWRQHRKHWDFARAKLWSQHFDVAIYLRWDADFYDGDFLNYASGAKWRMAYSENISPHKKWMNEGDDAYLTQILNVSSPKHEVESNLDFIRALGGTIENERLEIWTSPEDKAFAERALSTNGKTWVAIGPGARIPRRAWSLENFIELVRWLRETYNIQIVLLGGPDEKYLGEAFRQELGDGVLNLIGQTTLRQAEQVLERCSLYIGNDSGIMHLAAAARVPVVEISGHPLSSSDAHPNSPTRFGAWQVTTVVCRPAKPLPPCKDGCSDIYKAHCILQVTLDQVKQGVMELLESHVELNPVREVVNVVH